jgi:hypothetical protein
MGMQFGKRATESTKAYRQRKADSATEVWIKGFKEGQTKIRVCQPLETATHYEEHYGYGGYFMCADHPSCIGCTSESARTREHNSRHAFNALDATGKLQVYKVGAKFFPMLEAREDRVNAVALEDHLPKPYLMDRDYTVIRIGKEFNNTSYSYEAGDKYEVDLPGADELYDIDALLRENYARVYKENIGTEGSSEDSDPWADKGRGEPEPAREPERATTHEEPASGRITFKREGKPAAAKTAPAEERQPMDKLRDPDPEPEQDRPAAKKTATKSVAKKAAASTSPPDFDNLGSDELRAYLTERKVDFPPRASRARLAVMAEESKDLPPF